MAMWVCRWVKEQQESAVYSTFMMTFNSSPWPFLMPSPFTATVLFHYCLFFSCLSAFLSSPAFILSVSFPLFFSRNLRLVIVPSHSSPAPKRKWENGKSHSLLWHPCLPTHNAVLRFVQLPRSLLVCMYTSTPPPHTFPLSPNKGSGCGIFSCKTLCNVTPPPPTPRLLRKQVCWGEAANSNTQRERRLSMLPRHRHKLKIRQALCAGRDFSKTPSFTLMGGGGGLGEGDAREEITQKEI